MSIKGFNIGGVTQKYDYNALENIPESGGQPKPVKLASEMKDSKKIYLYVGEEEDYIFGHMYFWDNGSWTDLGLYGVGQKGDSGVYIGDTAPTDPNARVWIDTSGGANVQSAAGVSF